MSARSASPAASTPSTCWSFLADVAVACVLRAWWSVGVDALTSGRAARGRETGVVAGACDDAEDAGEAQLDASQPGGSVSAGGVVKADPPRVTFSIGRTVDELVVELSDGASDSCDGRLAASAAASARDERRSALELAYDLVEDVDDADELRRWSVSNARLVKLLCDAERLIEAKNDLAVGGGGGGGGDECWLVLRVDLGPARSRSSAVIHVGAS